jgi:hypothetical protein
MAGGRPEGGLLGSQQESGGRIGRALRTVLP